MICGSCGELSHEASSRELATHDCAHCGDDWRLAGRYTLVAPLAESAGGTTWKAHDTHGRPVAVKELPLRRAATSKARELIHREASVLRQLSHVGVPRFIDSFEQGRGRRRALYIVQELIDGPTLADELFVHRYTEDEVLALLEELLPVLSYLHNLSPPVVHRDLKPSNIMRRPSGQLVLVDFGSVRDAIESADGDSTVTGTFGYMAPEQLRGHADRRTDLYGLGALAVALLTRREPRTLLDVHGRLVWRPHATVTPETASLLDDLLEAAPEDRPPSAEALLTRLLVMRHLVSRGRTVAVGVRSPATVVAAPHGEIWRDDLVASVLDLGFRPPTRAQTSGLQPAPRCGELVISEPIAAALLLLFSAVPFVGLTALWPATLVLQSLVGGAP